jgi:hypothetical protein
MKPNAAHDDMTTWWNRAIETNVEALEQIVILLLRLAGIGTLVPEVATLPRTLRTRILHILRPAEFAMRRLILIAAAQIHVIVPTSPDSGLPLTKEKTDSGLPLSTGDHSGTPVVNEEGAPNTASSSSPLRGSEGRVETRGSTPIELPREAKPSGMANLVRGVRSDRQCRPIDNDFSIGETNARSNSVEQGHEPPHQLRLARFSRKPAYPLPAGARDEPAEIRTSAKPASFTLFDPFKRYGDPWLTEADIAALEDLDGHALRLARWTARRHLERTRPQRWSPIRPGRPPGWKKHPKTATDEVLKEGHTLALIALRPPDT